MTCTRPRARPTATAQRADARQDAAWRERILGWYAHSADARLSEVGRSAANFYGVQDLHGLIWEWTEDYAAMLVKEKVVKLRELSPLWEMHQEGVDLSKVQWAAH